MPTQSLTFLTLDEVAERLRLNYFTVYELVRSATLPAYRFGNRWRVTEEGLESYLEASRYQPTTTSGIPSNQSASRRKGEQSWPSASAGISGGSTSPRQTALALEDRVKQLTAKRPKNTMIV